MLCLNILCYNDEITSRMKKIDIFFINEFVTNIFNNIVSYNNLSKNFRTPSILKYLKLYG